MRSTYSKESWYICLAIVPHRLAVHACLKSSAIISGIDGRSVKRQGVMPYGTSLVEPIGCLAASVPCRRCSCKECGERYHATRSGRPRTNPHPHLGDLGEIRPPAYSRGRREARSYCRAGQPWSVVVQNGYPELLWITSCS